MGKPRFKFFRIFTTIFRGVQIFQTFTVIDLFSFIKGIGPAHADKYEEEAIEIEKECSLNICTCIGPIGLDYRLKGVAKDVQMKTFEEHVPYIS